MSAFETGRSVLTVLNDPSRAAMYGHLAGLAGVTAIHADGALHALTQLERTPVDAIICDAQMSDMSGAEFRSILADDGHARALPVYLVESGDGEASGFGVATAGPEVLAEALETLGIDGSVHPVPLSARAHPQLSGNIGPFCLTEFLNWAADLECSGHWLITVGTAGRGSRSGHLTMTAGRITYAECAGRVGREAVLELLRCAELAGGGGQFRFYQSHNLPPAAQPDLSAPTARLLMELAVDLDETAAQIKPQATAQARLH